MGCALVPIEKTSRVGGRLPLWKRYLSPGLAGLLGLTLAAQGAVVPGRWERVEALPAGTPVSLRLVGDRLLTGVLESSSREVLVLRLPQGPLPVPRPAILEISLSRVQPDPLLNGTLLGLAAGLAFGAALVAADGQAEGVSSPGQGGLEVRVQSGRSGFQRDAAVVAGSAALGALFGLLIDASEKRETTRHQLIYRARAAPSPPHAQRP